MKHRRLCIRVAQAALKVAGAALLARLMLETPPRRVPAPAPTPPGAN